MGSAVLGNAIGAIRDWSVTEAKQPRGARTNEAFGSLVFNDEVQQARLPKPWPAFAPRDSLPSVIDQSRIPLIASRNTPELIVAPFAFC